MKNFVITLLSIFVIGMGVYIVLDKFVLNKTEDNPSQENNPPTQVEIKTQPTYASVAGVYEYKSKSLDKLDGIDLYGSAKLQLYSNGTFVYHHYLMAPGGYMGNYILTDNTVKLNYLFELTSGAGVNVTLGTKDLTINSDGSITELNLKLGTYEISNAVLTKSTEALKDEFNQIITTYGIENNSDS